MYFIRKIDIDLDDWIKHKRNDPALIVGIRQCGKTESVREFAKRNKLQLIEMNFWTNHEYCSVFDGSLEVDSIISNISLCFPNIVIDAQNTLFFFDEIQDCPKARLSFKNFSKDGRYAVIGSGSYLGINGYIIGDSTPVTTGYDFIFNMKTMDFEEFLWALGYKKEQTETLAQYYNEKKRIPDNIHTLYKDLFLKYACIGGFPKVVLEYVKTKNIVSAYRVLTNTIFDMKGDFG
ncbi:MAG: AAA family ATPase [Bacilli bacterium]